MPESSDPHSLTSPLTDGTGTEPSAYGTTFWRVGGRWEALRPPPPPAVPSALERLGPSPFPKSRFPFLGFLATVYDHVAAKAGSAVAGDSPAPAGGSGESGERGQGG